MKDLKEAYKTIEADHFAPKMEISFIDGDNRQTFQYEKVTWNIGGEEKGLRYGENPGQEAALYKLVNGNIVLGDVETIQPGRYLASVPELLQSGKHPGKTNVTDTDNALNILRYLMDKPTALELDFPGVLDGVRGMKFINAVCDSSEQGNVWKKV